MNNKRGLSSTGDSHDQTTKPSRKNNNTAHLTPFERCLYCGGMAHSWVDCTNVCAHCNTFHPRKRCPHLSVDYYTPGGFRITDTSSFNGQCILPTTAGFGGGTTMARSTPLSPRRLSAIATTPEADIDPQTHMSYERMAMIAATPSSEPPKQTEATSKPGPERSGSNAMPLGPRRPVGTSWPSSKPPPGTQPQGSGQIGILAAKTENDVARERERKIWRVLQQQIQQYVDETASVETNVNHPSVRSSAKRRVKEALDILKPLILSFEDQQRQDSMGTVIKKEK